MTSSTRQSPSSGVVETLRLVALIDEIAEDMPAPQYHPFRPDANMGQKSFVFSCPGPYSPNHLHFRCATGQCERQNSKDSKHLRSAARSMSGAFSRSLEDRVLSTVESAELPCSFLSGSRRFKGRSKTRFEERLRTAVGISVSPGGMRHGMLEHSLFSEPQNSLLSLSSSLLPTPTTLTQTLHT